MTATDQGSDIQASDMIHPDGSAGQAAIRRRLDEIWEAAAARDFALLESFHLYDADFTSFKDAAPRDDAAGNAAGERGLFSALDGPAVDMRALQIRILGGVGLVTFDGHFSGVLHGSAVELDQQVTMVLVDHIGEWKIVHEHISPLVLAP